MVSSPITCSSGRHWVSTPPGMKHPQHKKTAGTFRPLERGMYGAFRPRTTKNFLNDYAAKPEKRRMIPKRKYCKEPTGDSQYCHTTHKESERCRSNNVDPPSNCYERPISPKKSAVCKRALAPLTRTVVRYRTFQRES